MNDLDKAFSEVSRRVEVLRKMSYNSHQHLCVRVGGCAGELGIAPELVIKVLKLFERWGIVRLTTWRFDAFREVDYREWCSDDFFYNPHDACYVRMRLA